MPRNQIQDLSEAIARCKTECDRLGLHSKDPVIMLWLAQNNYRSWDDLDYDGFANLYRFLRSCNRSDRQGALDL